ncbi:MAG: NERD domain-containing protein [Chloroflexota bacterium]|nr:NERD domain-containing protein [Chloroflexota bacterium]
MRLTTNDKLIERQSKIARYATFAGLAILVGSLITSFNNTFPIAIAYALLFVGFVLAYIGAVLANKYVKEPRADHALEKALKGFDNKNHLYNYLLPAPHVLLMPAGLLLLRVKTQDGPISCKGEKWQRPFQISRVFGGMGQEGLGNPAAELRDDIAKMKEWLADKLDNAAIVPIDGYVVFSDPRVQLTVEEPTVPVVRVEDLKEALRKSKRGAPLAPQVYDNLQNILDAQADGKTA